jgi:hypothetical protein
MNQKELRKLIRGRVRIGQLPPAFDGKTYGGRGRDTACDCCGEIISADEIEYQVEFIPPRGESRRAFVSHVKCHWIWSEESDLQRRRSGSSRALPLVWNAISETIRRVAQVGRAS